MVHYVVVNNTMHYPDGTFSHTSPVGGRFKTLSNARRYATSLDPHKSWGIVKVSGGDEKYMGMVFRRNFITKKGYQILWAWAGNDKDSGLYILNKDGSLARRVW